MTFPTWSGSPPPSPPFHSKTDMRPHHHDPMFLLGEIYERTNRLIEEAEWVRNRLEHGSEKFHHHEGRLTRMEAEVAVFKKPSPDEIPKWEKTLKRWLAWLVPIGVGLSTGQIQHALEWAKLLK